MLPKTFCFWQVMALKRSVLILAVTIGNIGQWFWHHLLGSKSLALGSVMLGTNLKVAVRKTTGRNWAVLMNLPEVGS